MSKGNFKVRCLETSVGNPYTVGKVYEFKNGHMINDDGEIWPSDYIEDFAAWQRWSGAKWELVHEQPYIRIFAHKNRIIATITKDEKKFTQSVSLTKAGDFNTAVKMVVEKLLDKFEVREQTHLTAPAFKVGDKVRLKKGLIERQKYGDIKLLPNMINDDVMTIIRISELNGIYYTDKDYYYSEEMLELAIETPAFDWEAFKAGKFAVHCDTEEKAKAFLKECDEQGMKWNAGRNPNAYTNWNYYKEKTLYSTHGSSNSLCYHDINGVFQQSANLPIIDYTPSKPAVKETESKPYRIVKQDKYEVGDKVKIIDKWVLGCHENSNGKMDKWLGKIMTIREVSFNDYKMEEDKTENCGTGWYWNNKCIEGKVVEDVPEKTAVKEVKRPAKVGEWIKIVNADHMERYRGCEEYKNGDILKVAKTNACCLDDVLAEGISEWIDKREYVVLENYQPEQSSLESKANYTTEIQIGDTVKVVNNGKCYTRYEEWFVKNAPQYLGKFAYGGMPKNGGSYKVLMKNDKDGLKYVIQEIDWLNGAVYLIDEKGIEKVR